MSERLISVIIPVYNAAAYLHRSIGAILDSSHGNIEVICVDDGSSDDSLSILQTIAGQDARVKVVSKPNGGVSSARNAGLALAKGDYISFVDSDDWIHRDCLKILLAEAEGRDADMAVCDFLEVRNPIPESFPPLQTDYLVSVHDVTSAGNDILLRSSCWGRIYRKGYLDGVTFPDGLQFGEDALFNAVAMSIHCNAKIIKVNLPLYYYFRYLGSLVSRRSAETAWLDLCRAYLDILPRLERKDICIRLAYRAALRYRHEGSFTIRKKEVKRNARAVLRSCNDLLHQEQRISQKEKIQLQLLAASPLLYRTLLLKNGKAALEWERTLKYRAKQERIASQSQK